MCTTRIAISRRDGNQLLGTDRHFFEKQGTFKVNRSCSSRQAYNHQSRCIAMVPIFYGFNKCQMHLRRKLLHGCWRDELSSPAREWWQLVELAQIIAVDTYLYLHEFGWQEILSQIFYAQTNANANENAVHVLTHRKPDAWPIVACVAWRSIRCSYE